MAIDSVPQVKKATRFDSSGAVDELDKKAASETHAPAQDPETRQTLDKASGLLQTIISDRISEKVIRKIPSDEYLHLLNLLDEIISGSIDKQV